MVVAPRNTDINTDNDDATHVNKVLPLTPYLHAAGRAVRAVRDAVGMRMHAEQDVTRAQAGVVARLGAVEVTRQRTIRVALEVFARV